MEERWHESMVVLMLKLQSTVKKMMMMVCERERRLFSRENVREKMSGWKKRRRKGKVMVNA